MADYNIYIHAIGTGGASNQSPTTPWSAREGGDAFSQTESQGGSDASGAVRSFTRAAAFVSNPDSLVSTGISKLAKFIPAILLAGAVVKISDAILSNVIEFSEIESGDYRNGIAYQNFKIGIHNVLRPISTAINHFKIERQWARENRKLEQQRDLLGDSVINSYTRRGV